MLKLAVKTHTKIKWSSFFLPTMQNLKGEKKIASLENLKTLSKKGHMQDILHQLVLVFLRVI